MQVSPVLPPVAATQPEPDPQPTAADIAECLRADLAHDLNGLPITLSDALELPNPPALAWQALTAWQAAEAAVLALAAELEVA